jgi:spore germination protein GerM
MCDGCNRARCVGCFYLFLAAISGYIVALPVYVCMLEYLLQTSEVLRIFPEAPTPGGSVNFLGGSELY